MQFIVEVLQIVALSVTIALVMLLLLTVFRLRKLRMMSDKLVAQIEEGREL